MSKQQELRRNEASAYARDHLRKVHADPETWEVEYMDPSTGTR
jgi:hypothetical protein